MSGNDGFESAQSGSALDRVIDAVDSVVGGSENDPPRQQQRAFQDPLADREMMPLRSRQGSKADGKIEKDGKGVASSDVKDGLPKAPLKKRESESDDEDKPKNTTDVFNRPLVYYKRNTPLLRARRPSKGPTQIVWPDKSMSIGFVPDKEAERERAERKNLDEGIVVFTSPNEDAVQRRRKLLCVLITMFLGEFILVTTDFSLKSPISGTDTTTYIGFCFAIVFGLLAMRWRDPRMITLFIVVFYADSFVALLRMDTILDWLRFFLQLVMCHWMRQFKETLLPSWFVPQSG